MELSLNYFGMIAEATNVQQEKLNLEVKTIVELKGVLIERYPAIEKLNYQFAVNQNIVGNDFQLSNGDEIALLPPFAGG
ncbi:MAG: MoaD/ThiS family protein [Vicingaceae bacterium]|nr:MoaD/ThiS family protein [Vicingaceae bacterium]